MAKKRDKQPDEQLGQGLPCGVRLLRTFEGHKNVVYSVAFDPSGLMLASGSIDCLVKMWDVSSGHLLRTLGGHKSAVWSVAFDIASRTLASANHDGTVKLWDTFSGELLDTLRGHQDAVYSVAFDPSGRTLASGSRDSTVKLWDASSGELLRTLRGHDSHVGSIAFDPSGQTLASGSVDSFVMLWDVFSGKLLRTLEGHQAHVGGVAFDPSGRTLASGSRDSTVKLWDASSGELLRTLEGHTRYVSAVAFSKDGRLMASRSEDGTLRLWNCKTWETVAIIPQLESRGHLISKGLAFHPTLSVLAVVGNKSDAPDEEPSKLIHLWEVDLNELLRKVKKLGSARRAVLPQRTVLHHTTAKVVLVGDHGVGKSGLGWRLAHGEFREQSSTHGQQFWVLPELGKLREDGTECEAILWDLAGQPDYRLIHALFLDDVDLALVLFDSSDISDPLHGVEFWLKQLKAGGRQAGCRTILVGAQADRGTPTLTVEELEEFCRRRGIGGYVSTSAKEGWGLEELVGRMKDSIPWEEKPATTTTVTFKRIKDYVLRLKEGRGEGQSVIVTPEELRGRLEGMDAEWQFTDEEMLAAVGHLENYGYVKRLRTSKGEARLLLSPELLNNLAASFVLEARRNPKGLGSLEERRLLAGEYRFPELEGLSPAEREILPDSAALLFLEHNVCFRETDPLGGQSYLVFPELINLKKPLLEDERPTEDGVAYTVSGPVENVYASLVVLLGYTQTFTRTDQWRNQARYEMGERLICGFRQEAERDGELDFVLYFGTNVGRPVRTLFQGLFESFLARRNLNVSRFEPVVCPNGHALNRAVVREQLRMGSAFAFCSQCGERLALPKADEPIQLTQSEKRSVDEQRWFADRRTRFEQAVFQLASYVESQGVDKPECFISYAWGDPAQERWVERNLAADLQKAGISVVLDRWVVRVGMSVPLFVERIEKSDRVIVVGTPLYRKKYENQETSSGFVVAAEVHLISSRMLGREAEKETVLPLLLEGDEATSLPPLLQRRVHADFRAARAYFVNAFDLMLGIYRISPTDKAVADLRRSLREPESPL